MQNVHELPVMSVMSPLTVLHNLWNLLRLCRKMVAGQIIIILFSYYRRWSIHGETRNQDNARVRWLPRGFLTRSWELFTDAIGHNRRIDLSRQMGNILYKIVKTMGDRRGRIEKSKGLNDCCRHKQL